jgi:hypothetical protein
LKATDTIARTLGISGLIVGLISLFLSYSGSTPSLAVSAELIDPVKVGTPLHFTIRLDNFGKTAARHLDARVALKFQNSNFPLVPAYSANPPPPHFQDLAPGAHVDLTTANPMHLEHDHDVDAVTSGEFAIFLFGKITYRDMFHLNHEFDFCRYYQAGQIVEPNKLRLCSTYNGEN